MSRMIDRQDSKSRLSHKERRLPASQALVLLTGDDDPQDEIDQYTRHTPRNERNEQRQAEPERTDAEELGKPAADTGDDAVAPGSAQSPFLIGCHFFNSFVVFRFHIRKYFEKVAEGDSRYHCACHPSQGGTIWNIQTYKGDAPWKINFRRYRNMHRW